MSTKPLPVLTCREADDASKPCRFADRCPPDRQEWFAAYVPPVNGDQCWRFKLWSLPPDDPAAEERAAIQLEAVSA